jgi:hypothetical protein
VSIPSGKIKRKEGKKMTMNELRIHTIKCAIQGCGMDGMTKEAVRKYLQSRYVNSDEGISMDEFTSILTEEYKKVEAWREQKMSRNMVYQTETKGYCEIFNTNSQHKPFDGYRIEGDDYCEICQNDEEFASWVLRNKARLWKDCTGREYFKREE